MANNPAMNPAAALGDATRFGDIRKRLAFLIAALIVYRIGTFIPVPGINTQRVAEFFNDQSGTILGVVNMFSGGALELGQSSLYEYLTVLNPDAEGNPSSGLPKKPVETLRQKLSQP